MNASPAWVTQFVLFFGVGAVATAAHYLVMIVLADVFHLHAVGAAACGYVTGAVVSYLLNYRYTFASKGAHAQTATRFVLVAASGLALNTLLVGVLVVRLGLHYLLAQLIATALILGWNFVLNKLWTFKE